MNIIIRLGRTDELGAILEVERLAGQRFSVYGINPTKEEDEREEESDNDDYEFGAEHEEGLKNNRLWVAVTPGSKIVGFALAQVVDNEGHLRELDVLQEYGRKGIGQTLINTVIDWCHTQGYTTLTLTTFKDIPFNRPYYEKVGFKVIQIGNLRGRLKEMITEENASSVMERVAMRKILSG